MKPDTPKELACLERARIWEGLIGWCEEMESEEFEAEVGQPDRDPAVMMSSFSDPGGTPALKRPIIPPRPPLEKGGEKDRRRDACATNRKTKTENRKRLLKGMTRAVARALKLI